MPWFDDPDKAIQRYSEAIAANPDSMRAYLYRGEAHRHLEQLAEAIADFTIVIELSPRSCNDSAVISVLVEAHICRGVTLGMQSDHLGAIKEFAQAIELNPGRYLAYYNRGVSWSHRKEANKAIEDYSRAIELEPDYSDAYLRRGLEWKKLGEHRKARADFAKVRELNRQAKPDDGRSRLE